MKLDWNFISVLVAVIIVVGGWGVSVELRMAQHASLNTIQESLDNVNSRVQNIEKLLMPVIVDYRVRKELEDRAAKAIPTPPTPPAPKVTSHPHPAPVKSDVESRAKQWAEEEIRRGQQSIEKN